MISHHNRRSLHPAAAFLFGLAVCSAACADTITLKTAARQRDGVSAVALGDVALLEGDEAVRLVEVKVAEMKLGAASALEVSVADVRRALDAAGANWARINLSGRNVIVRPSRSAGSLPPQAMSSVAINAFAAPHEAESFAITLDSIVREHTVRGSIANLVSTALNVDPRTVRITPKPEDASLLTTSLDSGRFQVQPLGSLAGDRIAFEIRTWNGTAVESKGQVALTVERLVSITRAVRDLSRGDVVNETGIEAATQWVSMAESAQAAPSAAVVGRTLTRSIAAGERIRARDIAQEAIVKRGDAVNVRCLVGGVAISIQAEARAEGVVGDLIEFRKSGERESFTARITARGEAIVDLAKR